MATTVISSAEVQRAAAEGCLRVPPGAVVTPLARDLAADLGVKILTDQHPDPCATRAASPAGDDDLVARVRAVLGSLLGGGGPVPARPPVKLVRQAEAVLEPFPPAPAGQDVRTVDVVTGADGAPMAAGYMSLTKGGFAWHLPYDEVQIVLEGELHLGGDGGGRVGRPGDVFYVPKGSSITFETPTWAKFVYVTFPANWQEAR